MPGSPGRFLTGAIAGLVATLPMTILMAIGKRRLSWQSQEPLPPRQITRGVLQTVNLDNEVSFNQEMVLTAVNHFAYGAGAGAAYGGLFPSRSLAGAVSAGIVYGLGVWTGSYFGWLPALGLYRSPAEDTAERNRLMIAAHVVWGGSLSLVTHLLSQSAARSVTGPGPEVPPDQTENTSQSVQPSCEITP
jgi:hypothetical protein